MAITNALTNLLAPSYLALQRVSRELVGMIPAVHRDAKLDRLAIGRTAYVPVTPAITPVNITPAATAPDTGGQTHTTVAVEITKSMAAPFGFDAEDEEALRQSGNYDTLFANKLQQAIRSLANLIEIDLCALYAAFSRAYGTAGTAPFGTANVLTDAAGVNRILNENGAPREDRQLVVGHAAMMNIQGVQSSLWKVNEAGTDEMLRQGMLSTGLLGLALRHSGAIATHTKGTGSGYLVNNGAGYAVGSTAITVDTGSGTIVAGDVLTAAGNTDKHLVASALAANVVTLAAPGLRSTLADNTALTVGNSYEANMAFSRSAIVLAQRLPPKQENDGRTGELTITDPLTGLSFEVTQWGQYRQAHWEVACSWGVKVIQPEHCMVLLG